MGRVSATADADFEAKSVEGDDWDPPRVDSPGTLRSSKFASFKQLRSNMNMGELSPRGGGVADDNAEDTSGPAITQKSTPPKKAIGMERMNSTAEELGFAAEPAAGCVKSLLSNHAVIEALYEGRIASLEVRA